MEDQVTASPIAAEALHETSIPADCLNSQRYDPANKNDLDIFASQPADCVEQKETEVSSNCPIPTIQATESLQSQAYDLYLNSVMQSSTIRQGLGSQLDIEPRPSIGAEVSSEDPMTMKKESVEDAPVPGSFSARESFFAELAGISTHHPMHMRNVDQSLNVHGSYSVFCNECDHAIPGAHYHCSICDDGDFDLCQSCVESGVLCGGEGHWLIKRIVKNGKVINSTTETIAPKASKAENEKESPASEAKGDDALDIETRTCNSCVGGEPTVRPS